MENQCYTLANIKDIHFEVCNICNLSCIYCSAYNPNSDKMPFMPIDIAYRYIDLVFERTCADDIGLMFYGGEALLQNVSWFYDVIEYAKNQAMIYDKKLHFYMQSCATFLDDERLELIKKYDINIGSSLDGPPEINDKTRGKTNLVLKNIIKLKEVGCFGGVICTANEYNYDKISEILKFFEDQEIFWVAVNIVSSIGRGRNLNPLTKDKIFMVYKGIYDYLKKTKGKKVVEGNLAERLDKYIYPHSSMDFKQKLTCNHPICGGGITLMICDIKGDLYPCGCSNMTNEFRLGNINSLNDQIFLEQVNKFHSKNKKYYEECRLCDASRICNFGCTGFIAIDNVTYESECQATKLFYSFLENTNQSVIQEIVQNLRTGKQEHDWRSKNPRG